MSANDYLILENEFSETKAHLYKTILIQNGLNPVITNKTMASVLPMHDSGFIIRIPKEEYEEAKSILKAFKVEMNTKKDESFHYADKADIQYEKELNQYENKLNDSSFKEIIWIIIAILVIALLSVSIQTFK